jgi:hypothetical protein
MSKFKTSAIYKVVTPAKGKSLESGYVYFKNVPVTYAKVQPDQIEKKLEGDDREWSLTAFIDSDTLEQCEAMPINKGFSEVGVTKKKKGPNRGQFKFPLDKEAYQDYKGLHGFNVACPEFTKSKKKKVLKVVDSKGKPFTEEVGNGSICTIKCFAYRNRDEELVITMDTLVVIEHVPYEGGGDSSGGFDDELGFEIPSDSEFGGEDMSEFEDAPEEDTPPFDEDEMEEDY